MTGKKTASELIDESEFYTTRGTLAVGGAGFVPEKEQREYYAKVVELTKAATEVEPESSRAWITYSMSLLLQDRYDEAKEAFKKGVGLCSGEFSIAAHASKQLIGAALIFEDLGIAELSQQCLIALVNNIPKFAQGWTELAAFYGRHGRPDVSREMLERGLQQVGYLDILETLPNIRGKEPARSAIATVLATIRSSLLANRRTVVDRTEFRDRTREENRLIVLKFKGPTSQIGGKK